MTPGSHERVLLHLLYPTLPRSRIGPEEETGADGSHVDGGGTGTRVCRVRGPWHPTVQRCQPFARRPRAPILHRCPYRYPACSSSSRLTTSSEHSALAWPSEHSANPVCVISPFISSIAAQPTACLCIGPGRMIFKHDHHTHHKTHSHRGVSL